MKHWLFFCDVIPKSTPPQHNRHKANTKLLNRIFFLFVIRFLIKHSIQNSCKQAQNASYLQQLYIYIYTLY